MVGGLRPRNIAVITGGFRGHRGVMDIPDHNYLLLLRHAAVVVVSISETASSEVPSCWLFAAVTYIHGKRGHSKRRRGEVPS